MNWNCEQIEARLSDFLEGALTPEEAALFVAHSSTCAQCQELVASVRGLIGAMHALEPVAAPVNLMPAILNSTLGPRPLLADGAHGLDGRALFPAALCIWRADGADYSWRSFAGAWNSMAHADGCGFESGEFVSQRRSKGTFGLCEGIQVCRRSARCV